MSKRNQKIETHGNQSPGYVARDYTINQTIINQYESKKRKKWRPLETLLYPVLTDNENFRFTFINDLAIGLHNVFEKNGYIKFNGMLRLSKKINDHQELIVYELICNQPEFSEDIRKRYNQYINDRLSIDGKGEKQRRKLFSRLKNEWKEEWGEFFKNWRIIPNVIFSSSEIPLEFIYDPATKFISIRSFADITANISDYEEELKTTSELLRFIPSISVLPLAYIGNFVWLEDNYPLMKLIIDIADNRGILVDNIRINVDDYEEWDYINKALDEEVKIRKAKKIKT